VQLDINQYSLGVPGSESACTAICALAALKMLSRVRQLTTKSRPDLTSMPDVYEFLSEILFDGLACFQTTRETVGVDHMTADEGMELARCCLL